MELEAQEGGYVRMDLCETSNPVPVSVFWESTDDISFAKTAQKALLRETLVVYGKSSVLAVCSVLLLAPGDYHLDLPRKNGNGRILEYLKPNDGT